MRLHGFSKHLMVIVLGITALCVCAALKANLSGADNMKARAEYTDGLEAFAAADPSLTFDRRKAVIMLCRSAADPQKCAAALAAKD